MSTVSDLKRYRDQAVKIREDISRQSSIVASKRKKAAEAKSAAARNKSETIIRSKLREAETALKDANSAEAKRAGLEKNLATTEKKTFELQTRNEKEQRQQTERALEASRRANDTATIQFRGPTRTLMGNPAAATDSDQNDVFLSHASEDKDDIARPLRDALEQRGVSVWFDEIRIKVGQSIRQEIEDGIRNARFGVVILSPDFFAKQWTQVELDAFFTKKASTGRDLILPVWHRVTKAEVESHSPLVAGLFALNSSIMTIEQIAEQNKLVIKE